MKRIISLALCIAFTLMITALTVFATAYHTVVKGDTMWRIAKTYEVGLSEIKSANTHIKNPDLIYPGQVLTIPMDDLEAKAFDGIDSLK